MKNIIILGALLGLIFLGASCAIVQAQQASFPEGMQVVVNGTGVWNPTYCQPNGWHHDSWTNKDCKMLKVEGVLGTVKSSPKVEGDLWTGTVQVSGKDRIELDLPGKPIRWFEPSALKLVTNTVTNNQ